MPGRYCPVWLSELDVSLKIFEGNYKESQYILLFHIFRKFLTQTGEKPTWTFRLFFVFLVFRNVFRKLVSKFVCQKIVLNFLVVSIFLKFFLYFVFEFNLNVFWKYFRFFFENPHFNTMTFNLVGVAPNMITYNEILLA